MSDFFAGGPSSPTTSSVFSPVRTPPANLFNDPNFDLSNDLNFSDHRLPLVSADSPNILSRFLSSFPDANVSQGNKRRRDDEHHSQVDNFMNLRAPAVANHLPQVEEVPVPRVELGGNVLVPATNQLPPLNEAAPAAPQRTNKPNLSMVVKLDSLDPIMERNARENMRNTRMLHDSLRLVLMMERQELIEAGEEKRWGMDSKAALVMGDHFLWLHRDKRIVGSIPGIDVGSIYFYRMELCVVGLHWPPQAGIDYVPGSQTHNGQPVATSIILSDGYGDDDDQGATIIYTGQGGKAKNGRQLADQKMEKGNLALLKSMEYGSEVRVIRGMNNKSSISRQIYVYDGLYKVTHYWSETGESGHKTIKFKLTRIDGQAEMGSSIIKFAQKLRVNPYSLRPNGYITFDISKEQEIIPVALFNDIDSNSDPISFTYITKAVFQPFTEGVNLLTSCNCVDKCRQDCPCALKNLGNKFAYDYQGHLLQGTPVIYECGPWCSCPPSCHNRVSQWGIKYRFEIFRSGADWGLRSMDVINAGSFVCEFAAYAASATQNTMIDDLSLRYPDLFNSAMMTKWGDISQVKPNREASSLPAPKLPPPSYVFDTSKKRNIAAYIKQSKDPNLMAQYVLNDHSNLHYPRVLLFAMTNILPMTQLTLDY